MNIFHKHKWKIILKTYCPAVTMNREIRCSEWLLERLLRGLITIIFQCEKCHKIRKEEILGQEIKGEQNV